MKCGGALFRYFRKEIWCTIIWIFVGSFAFLADQLSKYWATRHVTTPWQIRPWLTLELSHNTGIAWSLGSALQGCGYAALMMTIGCVALILVVISYQAMREKSPGWIALAVAAAGGVSNLYDRVATGAVTDFIVLHGGGWEYPAFNLADVCIVVGIALYALILMHRGFDCA